jgi:hypothetical protein
VSAEVATLRWTCVIRRWWRAVLLAHAAVALACAVQIIGHAAAYWAPCYRVDYDGPACLWAQTDGVPGTDSVYDGIVVWWVSATATAVVAAVVCRAAGRPHALGLATALPPLLINPIGEYFLTPLVNGFYTSHDTHPWTGVPLGAAVAVSGVVAVVGASRRARRHPESDRALPGDGQTKPNTSGNTTTTTAAHPPYTGR